ncbi:MAG: DUF5060 domain-containing protein [Flavobacteriales bacterium]|nr:DUF5060 domain-containing protein [Flavobacteriales bacterium]
MRMMRYARSFLFLLVLIPIGMKGQQSPLTMKNSEFKLSWLSPIHTEKEVGLYDKLEFGIRLKDEVNKQIELFIADQKQGLNPFDPKAINVQMTFYSPDNDERKVYAFYYKDYKRDQTTWTEQPTEFNWRIRFAPDQLGRWKFILKIFIRGEEVASIGSKFLCVPSNSKGVVKRNYKGDETDRYLYLSETKSTFFTIGHNIAHSAYYKLTPEKALRHQQWLKELADNGGNFFRLELGAPNGLPDWGDYMDYSLKMPQMWEFDQLTEYARERELYFILFRHHTEMMQGEDWDVAKWDNNPYKKGFDLKSRREYFEREDVLEWQKNALRYIFSRWGYNTSLAFYEYQEIDNWLSDLKKESGLNDAEALRIFTTWYTKQRDYIRYDLEYNPLFINTYATTPDLELNNKNKYLFYHSDVIGFHKYGQDKDINYNSKFDKAEEFFKVWKKPVFVEEMGLSAGGNTDFLPLYKCSGVEFHNSIWSTAFMGTAGIGMNWWWDRGLHDFGHVKDYKALKMFFDKEPLEEEKYVPQKWHNTLSLNRAMLENYVLVNSKQTKCIGWVHNASHYWRNVESDCLNELVNDGKFKEPYQLQDGFVLGKENRGTDFSGKKDNYTSKGGSTNIEDKSFEIGGLKAGGLFSKRKWYQITFYSTKDGSSIQTDKLNTNIWGKLKPDFPGGKDFDYAYKITYLGEGKKP